MPELPQDIAALQMRLRSGGVVGGTKQQLTPAQRDLFEEGLALVFERWTALCLAVDQQWGGQGSADKAQDLYLDVLEWFDKGHGALLACLPACLPGCVQLQFGL